MIKATSIFDRYGAVYIDPATIESMYVKPAYEGNKTIVCLRGGREYEVKEPPEHFLAHCKSDEPACEYCGRGFP